MSQAEGQGRNSDTRKASQPSTVVVEVFNDTLGTTIPVEVRLGWYGWCDENGSGEVKIGARNARNVIDANGQLVFIRSFMPGESAEPDPLAKWYKNIAKMFS